MADDNNPGSNGGGTLSQHVAGVLMGLNGRIDIIGRKFDVIGTRIEGLARVLLRGVPFDGETAGKVAVVIDEAATAAHQYGEELFVAAQDIRAMGKTGE